ncbi:MAG: hypothetical protein M4579_007252 [Chaenotheca gracillima]|nr:MAG: hypothetical protein M4579_007252 [Chaenotheca gracillima]
MGFTKSSLFALALAFSSAHAHMIMTTPTPFNAANINNFPLDRGGSDFPCKAGPSNPDAYKSSGDPTSMPLGSTQKLAFKGGATHGGGSCQVSVTYDKNPTKQSEFKVIHSIIGGCPAKNTEGNIGGDASAPDPDTYSFKIPDDLPTGQATLAWTWYNKVGNREIYMNCAPVTFTGGKSKRNESTVEIRDQSAFDKLPDMFVANIPTISKYSTLDSTNVVFPNPGDSVDHFTAKTDGSNAAPASSGGSKDGSGDGGPPPASGGQGDPATPPPAASAPPPAASTPPPASPGIFAPTSSSGGSQAPSATAALPQPSSAPPSSGGNSSSAGGQTGPCSSEGQFSCLTGGTSFQQCASGQWSVVQQVAAGTTCSPGGGTSMKIAAVAPAKRHIRFPRSHARRLHA